MRTNRTPDEWNKSCLARERIDEELKEYYRACTTGELAPQLLAPSKSLMKNSSKSKTNKRLCHNAASRRLGPSKNWMRASLCVTTPGKRWLTCISRTRAGTPISSQASQQRRGAPDRDEYREVPDLLRHGA